KKSAHPPAFEYGRGRGSPFPVDKNKIAYISLVNSRAEALGYKTRKIARLLLPGVPNRFFSRDTRICLHEQVSYPTPVIRPVANLGTQPGNSVRRSRGKNVAHYTWEAAVFRTPTKLKRRDVRPVDPVHT